MPPPPFTIWLSGLPASGKTTLARALARQLQASGFDAALLISDLIRPAPLDPWHEESALSYFYQGLVHAGWLLSRQGIPLIVDTPAHLAAYRDQARRRLPRFVEVYVDTPLAICMTRDFPRLLRQARMRPGRGCLPFYEIPAHPDVVVAGVGASPEDGARRIIAAMERLGYLERETGELPAR